MKAAMKAAMKALMQRVQRLDLCVDDGCVWLGGRQ